MKVKICMIIIIAGIVAIITGSVIGNGLPILAGILAVGVGSAISEPWID
jgi:hypothetical protein